MRLPRTLSIYLDLVRFGAALVVVLSHAWPILFPTHPLPWPGHDAVVVFFVLSGLVVAHATDRPGLTLADYANHRLARVWSVTIPALVLSVVVSLSVGGAGLPAAPSVSGWLDGAWRIVASLFFIGQIWSLDVDPPLNDAFWSLNFEVWYYALFGAWVFLEGRRRAIAIAIIALAAGPKILLLLPVWLLGVGLYYHRLLLGERTALTLLLATAVLAIAFIQCDVSKLIRHRMVAHWPEAMAGLGGANQFVGDLLLAIAIAANFTAAASLGRFGAPLLTFAQPIKAAAGCTFSSYLYHLPLLVLAVIAFDLRTWTALLAIAVGVLALAQVSEKQLPTARRMLRRVAHTI